LGIVNGTNQSYWFTDYSTLANSLGEKAYYYKHNSTPLFILASMIDKIFQMRRIPELRYFLMPIKYFFLIG